MKILFVNGEAMDCLGVHGKKVNYQGVARDSLTFLFPNSIDLGILTNTFTPENCKTITIVDDDHYKNIHEHYTIRTKLGSGLRDVALGIFDIQDDSAVCYVTMAQTTEAERMMQSQQAAIETLILTTLERRTD